MVGIIQIMIKLRKNSHRSDGSLYFVALENLQRNSLPATVGYGLRPGYQLGVSLSNENWGC